MTTQPAEQVGEQQDPQGDQGGDNSLIRDLRQRAAGADAATQRAEAAEQRAKAAEQQIALLQLGVKPDSPQGKKLLRLHEGDWTPDALRATATDYGEELPGAVPAEQVAAAERMATVAQGAEHTSGSSEIQDALNKLPKWGAQDFYAGKRQLLDLVEQHGGEISNERAAAPTWVNPFTNKRMAAYDQSQAAPRA